MPDDFLGNWWRELTRLITFPLFFLGAAAPRRGMDHELNLAWLNEDLSPQELITLEYRYPGKSAEVLASLARLGYNKVNRKNLEDVYRPLIVPFDLLTLNARGHLKDHRLDTKLQEHGFTEHDAAAWKQLYAHWPSVQDIITFAVREIYNPEIAEAFNQFEGFGTVYDNALPHLKAQGISREVFKNYWGAHWQLPSLLQGFEMMHRGVIPATSGSSTDLSLHTLMIALDIMPAWREPLTKISYRPYTRVDVRRMHKAGVVSEDELLKAYTDIGYDNEHASKMRDFTVKYNADPTEEELRDEASKRIRIRDLTKSDILNSYEDGLIEETKALQSLMDIGFDQTEAKFLVKKADSDRKKRENRESMARWKKLFQKGHLEETPLRIRLAEIGITQRVINELIKIWEIEESESQGDAKLNKGDLVAFYKAAIINREVFGFEMANIGYSEKHIGWFLKLMSRS